MRASFFPALSFLFFLSGCSFFFGSGESNEEASPAAEEKLAFEVAQIGEVDGHKQLPAEVYSAEPLEFDVVDELHDGRDLHILVSITANADWPLSAAALRLRGYREGEQVAEKSYILDQIRSRTSDRLQTGEEFQVALRLPAEGLTDYQLELLWGKEAMALEKEGSKVQMLFVTAEDVQEAPLLCSDEPCPAGRILSGVLSNRGEEVVDSLTLAIGWQDKGSLEVLAREEVSLEDLGLQPGARKAFEFEVLEENDMDREAVPFVHVLP